MSSLTPNHGLKIPDPADTVVQVKSDYAYNLNIIDGMGGGHTIVDENGTEMPSEGKLQFTGGVQVSDDNVNGATVVNVSGGGNVFGAFVDTSRVIVPFTTFRGTMSYTATEDCFIDLYIVGTSGSNVTAQIDGEPLGYHYYNNTYGDSNLYPLKKGQVFSISGTTNQHDSGYTVFGTTQGTKQIFAPVIYSDTERVIGVWRDNKPLYQKTWDISDLSISYNSWTISSIPVGSMETIVNVLAINQSGKAFWGDAMASIEVDPTYIGFQTGRNGNNTERYRYVTIQYTKTTDVAGSGDYNTLGVPTVHYSTNEQVIGTYLGKPLYQRTWDFVSTNIINANTWTNLFSNDIDIDKVTMNETLDDQGCSNKVAYCGVRNGYIAVYSTYATNIQTITLRYTKTTD